MKEYKNTQKEREIDYIFGEIINNYYGIEDGIYTKKYNEGILYIDKKTIKKGCLDANLSIKYMRGNERIYEVHYQDRILSIINKIDENTEKTLTYGFWKDEYNTIKYTLGENIYTVNSNNISISYNSNIKSGPLNFEINNDIITFKINNNVVLGYDMKNKLPYVYLKNNNNNDYIKIIYDESFNEKLETYNTIMEHNIDLINKTVSEEFKKLFKSYEIDRIQEIPNESFYELIETATIYQMNKKYLDNKDIIDLLYSVNNILVELYNNKDETKINGFENYIKSIDFSNPQVLKNITKILNSSSFKRSVRRLSRKKNK